MKKNILFVVDNATFGGGEKLFEQIIRHLDTSRFTAFIACTPAGHLIDQVRAHATIIPLDISRQVSPGAFFSLCAAIRQNHIDIINSQGTRADFYARLAGAATGVRQIYATVACPPEGFDVGAPRKLLYVAFNRFAQGFSHRIFVPSEALRLHFVNGESLPDDRVILIPNGVDLTAFQHDPEAARRIRAEFGIGADTILAGTICRLVWQKGLPYFIEAVRLIAAQPQPPKIRFLIAGEGPEEGALRAAAERAGVSHLITFAGFRNDVTALLSAMDLYVLSSVQEGQPIAVIEAMAASKPIIATDIEGVNETIEHGTSGMLVPPADPPALCSAIIQAAADIDGLSRMAAAARRRAEKKYDLNAIIIAYERYYAENPEGMEPLRRCRAKGSN